MDVEQLCALHHLWMHHLDESVDGAPAALREEALRCVTAAVEEEQQRVSQRLEIVQSLLQSLGVS
jgi:hypothetical protein